MKSAHIDKYVYSTSAIGKGAFSKVYKGFNIETDEIVAIKIIDKYQLKATSIKRLHDEILLLTQLHHPNIVELREFLEDKENFYLILEYCAGGDLSFRIKKGPILEEITQNYMRQISNALGYLRQRNLIHRDLKPQNILLTGDLKTIKLTDFNFARELYENDLAQTICGSPLYMAPEIIENHKYTVKSDLWSVGMVLYEMIYGITPYSESFNMVDLLKKINTRPIEYTDKASTKCNDLLRHLLQKDPRERYDWNEFFTHPWLRIDEPKYLESDQEDVWESITLSSISSPKPGNSSKPIPIPKVTFVEDYLPFGVSPPKQTKSEPITMGQISRREFRSGSAPETRTMTDHLWKYMSNSMGVIKGAVDYLSSATE